MKNSIFSKIFSGFVCVILLFSSLVLFFSFRTIRMHYINTLSLDLKNLSFALMPQVLTLIESDRCVDIDKLVKRIGSRTNTRITVISPEGVVWADSEKDPLQMENHSNRREVVSAIKNGFGSSLRFSNTVKEEMLYVAVPIISKHKLLGVLRVSLFLRDINRLLGILKWKIAIAVVVITFISLLISWWISKTISFPLTQLAEFSEKVSCGDFSVQLNDVSRDDEIGCLYKSFNEMVGRLQVLFEDLKLKQEELNSIINSLREGLVVLDKEGRIVLCNASFKKMIGSDLKGKFWWEVIRDYTLSHLMGRVQDIKDIVLEELEYNDRSFLCSIAFIPGKEEIVLVFHDITEFRKLEKIKKDFIVNVSHELRTPLTAIKGYVETIEEELTGEVLRYVDIIKRHTDRLISIVEDLLTLSEIENISLNSDVRERVQLSVVISEVIKVFERRAEEKNLILSFLCEKDAVIYADPIKIEQLLINLVDNAIKYTEQGKVEVVLTMADERPVLIVRDTGIGIPEEDIDRIFERFYVVDKSRSKQLGGTGLGLSIVKHIAMLYGADIEVISKVSQGTEFRIIFPHKLCEFGW